MKLKGESLLEMINMRGEWCVSLYLPLNQNDSSKNRRRLKKLMFEAEKKLIELGTRLTTVARMLLPIERILDNNQFWKDKKNGLGIFLTPDSFNYSLLPVKPGELAIVSNQFYLKPLVSDRSSQLRREVKKIVEKKDNSYRNKKSPMIPCKLLTSQAVV